MLFCLLRLLFFVSVPCLLAQVNNGNLDLSEMVNDQANSKAEIQAVCGPHPLNSILARVEGKMFHDDVVKMLTSIRFKAARLWKAYEHALRKYTTCKLMAAGGTLG